jgi:hypothetical protein
MGITLIEQYDQRFFITVYWTMMDIAIMARDSLCCFGL